MTSAGPWYSGVAKPGVLRETIDESALCSRDGGACFRVGAARARKLRVRGCSLTNALQDIDSSFDRKTGNAIGNRLVVVDPGTADRGWGAGTDLHFGDTKWMSYLAQKAWSPPKKSARQRARAYRAHGFAARTARHRPHDRLAAVARDRWAARAWRPDHVPAGIYAKEALQHLGAWNNLEPRLAPAEDVRGALALVERGERRSASST